MLGQVRDVCSVGEKILVGCKTKERPKGSLLPGGLCWRRVQGVKFCKLCCSPVDQDLEEAVCVRLVVVFVRIDEVSGGALNASGNRDLLYSSRQ